MTATAKVKAWIEEQFDPGSITVKPCPVVPGGQIITDAQGQEMLVYYDIMTDEVRYQIKDKETRTPISEEGKKILLDKAKYFRKES